MNDCTIRTRFLVAQLLAAASADPAMAELTGLTDIMRVRLSSWKVWTAWIATWRRRPTVIG